VAEHGQESAGSQLRCRQCGNDEQGDSGGCVRAHGNGRQTESGHVQSVWSVGVCTDLVRIILYRADVLLRGASLADPPVRLLVELHDHHQQMAALGSVDANGMVAAPVDGVAPPIQMDSPHLVAITGCPARIGTVGRSAGDRAARRTAPCDRTRLCVAQPDAAHSHHAAPAHRAPVRVVVVGGPQVPAHRARSRMHSARATISFRQPHSGRAQAITRPGHKTTTRRPFPGSLAACSARRCRCGGLAPLSCRTRCAGSVCPIRHSWLLTMTASPLRRLPYGNMPLVARSV
jgi:hypothetical protein